MTTLIFPTVPEMAAALAEHTRVAAQAAIAARGAFTFALTGGSAATALYPGLVAAGLDWSRTTVTFSDERCVPPDHEDSNYRLAKACFLGPAQVPETSVLRIEGERPPAEAAAQFAARLPPLDVVHLGLGPDGHVCSLFPGHALLEERAREVAFLLDSPKPPSARVTLTPGALSRAGALWFLVLGEAKAEVVRQVLKEPRSPLPAARAMRSARAVTWFLDEAAASRLARR